MMDTLKAETSRDEMGCDMCMGCQPPILPVACCHACFEEPGPSSNRYGKKWLSLSIKFLYYLSKDMAKSGFIMELKL